MGHICFSLSVSLFLCFFVCFSRDALRGLPGTGGDRCPQKGHLSPGLLSRIMPVVSTYVSPVCVYIYIYIYRYMNRNSPAVSLENCRHSLGQARTGRLEGPPSVAMEPIPRWHSVRRSGGRRGSRGSAEADNRWTSMNEEDWDAPGDAEPRRETRSRSPRRPDTVQRAARATEQRPEERTERATEQLGALRSGGAYGAYVRPERSWGFFKAMTDELETWAENPWSLEDWYWEVSSADTSGLRFGASRNISTMSMTAVFLVRARAEGNDDWREGAEKILKLAHHVARQYVSFGATEHRLSRRVLQLLYDFLNTRLEAAAIRLAIDRALGMDGDNDDASEVERWVRGEILAEAERKANARGSDIKVALGLTSRL